MKRRAILYSAFGAAAMALATTASAQQWPQQPVKIIVPYVAGGAVDMMARVLADRLGARWKQPVVVDNKAGGSEIVAATFVKDAPPDGTTLFLATEVGLETNAYLFSKLPYDPAKDFLPITRVVEGALIYVVRADSPYKTLADLIAQAKAKPNTVSYGSSGPGGAIHLATAWLGTVAGDVQFLHVPYKGSAPTMTDLLAGQIEFTAAPLSVVAPFVESGKMRAIAVSSPARIAPLPDVPSFTELGYGKAVSQFMLALVAPAKTPMPVATFIASEVAAVVADKAFQEKNVDPFGFKIATETPEAFKAFLEKDRDVQRMRVEAAKVKLD
ncbi:MAG: tripartite tricarboxylate transporter substrate binding protein [Reyranellaceae bacterium]